MKLLVLVLVSVALVGAGGARAMAFSHPMGSEGLVICSEGGEEVIYLDAKGQPVDPMADCSKCPECLTNSLLAVPVPAFALETPTAPAARHPAPASFAVTLSRHLRPQSRGPPPAPPEKHDTAQPAVVLSLGVTTFAFPSDRTERAFPEARS